MYKNINFAKSTLIKSTNAELDPEYSERNILSSLKSAHWRIFCSNDVIWFACTIFGVLNKKYVDKWKSEKFTALSCIKTFQLYSFNKKL